MFGRKNKGGLESWKVLQHTGILILVCHSRRGLVFSTGLCKTGNNFDLT